MAGLPAGDGSQPLPADEAAEGADEQPVPAEGTPRSLVGEQHPVLGGQFARAHHPEVHGHFRPARRGVAGEEAGRIGLPRQPRRLAAPGCPRPAKRGQHKLVAGSAQHGKAGCRHVIQHPVTRYPPQPARRPDAHQHAHDRDLAPGHLLGRGQQRRGGRAGDTPMTFPDMPLGQQLIQRHIADYPGSCHAESRGFPR
jgi:hypothetical protein